MKVYRYRINIELFSTHPSSIIAVQDFRYSSGTIKSTLIGSQLRAIRSQTQHNHFLSMMNGDLFAVTAKFYESVVRRSVVIMCTERHFLVPVNDFCGTWDRPLESNHVPNSCTIAFIRPDHSKGRNCSM